MLAQGNYFGALILLAICGGIAGNIDNLLRPRLVGKDTQMHDLFVLFSTLGGISMFGILGIIIGPIIAALFITLWELYGKAFRAYLPGVGPLRPISAEAAEEIDAANKVAAGILSKEDGLEDKVEQAVAQEQARNGEADSAPRQTS